MKKLDVKKILKLAGGNAAAAFSALAFNPSTIPLTPEQLSAFAVVTTGSIVTATIGDVIQNGITKDHLGSVDEILTDEYFKQKGINSKKDRNDIVLAVDMIIDDDNGRVKQELLKPGSLFTIDEDIKGWLLESIEFEDPDLAQHICEAVDYVKGEIQKWILKNGIFDVILLIVEENKAFAKQITELKAVLDKVSEKDIPAADHNIIPEIWEAVQKSHFSSHRKGNRFASLNIVEQLLPKGIINDSFFDFHFNSNDMNLKSIDDICDTTDEDISIIGEGGIGKTTFLQKIMERNYGTEDSPGVYRDENIVPVFVELNRCPKEIGSWYDDRYKKTNFITRYIADLIKAYTDNGENYEHLLESVELAFRKAGKDSTKTFLLLLDGFNEVSTKVSDSGESVRALLSQEISELCKLDNIRIITTSRVTQAAYYSKDFVRVVLKGLTDSDIRGFLKTKGFYDVETDRICLNQNLMKCLRVPLFLCMFAIQKEYGEITPETRGEILFSFFHQNNHFYNLRGRAEAAKNNPLQSKAYATELVLDFILPYIGWVLVQRDTFFLTKKELKTCLEEAVYIVEGLLDDLHEFPLKNYGGELKNAYQAVESLKKNTDSEIQETVIACVRDYLSIVYESVQGESVLSGKYRYSFVHHHFRDYFSAIWNVQILNLIPYMKPESVSHIHKSVMTNYWSSHEVEMIGQILMEHRNKPILDEKTQNWSVPVPITKEQTLLENVIDFFRKQGKGIEDGRIVYQNIINTLTANRGGLAGVHFDKLDLRGCNLHGISCSKRGKTEKLAASFNGCRFTEDTFLPMEHNEMTEELLYAGNICITLDQGNVMKVWDVISGNQVLCHYPKEDGFYPEVNAVHHMEASSDGRLLGLKIQPSNPESKGAYLDIFVLGEQYAFWIEKVSLPKKHNRITSFAFSRDDFELYVLADEKYFYAFKKATLTEQYVLYYSKIVSDTMKYSRMFVSSEHHIVYLFSYQFTPYSDFDEEHEEDIEEDYEDDTICTIIKCNIDTDNVEVLTSFVSESGTSPAFTYIPYFDCFLFYDDTRNAIILYNCIMDDSTPVFQKIIEDSDGYPPERIHYLNGSKGLCYIMYQERCDLVEVNPYGANVCQTTFDVPGIQTMGFDTSSELRFWVNTAPSEKRILLWNDHFDFFEWNIEESNPELKYNTRLYDTVLFSCDKNRDCSILVHAQNGISIFSLSEKELVHSITFQDSMGFRIGEAVYSDATGIVALLFESEQHCFVRLLNIDDQSYEDIYSAKKPSDESEKLRFDVNGRHLLIVSVDECQEYDIISKKMHVIYKTVQNEGLTEGYYTADDIVHLGIAPARTYLQPQFEPRCEIFRRGIDGEFFFVKGYMIPELPEHLVSGFLHKNHDTGNACNLNPKGLQAYWITVGFFAELAKETAAFLKLPAFVKNSAGNIVMDGTMELTVCDYIQVRHSHSIDYQSAMQLLSVGDRVPYCYSYLARDFSKAITIYDYQLICYWNDIKNKPKDRKIFNYKDTELFQGSNAEVTVWDIAIPGAENEMLCCKDSYRIFPVDLQTDQFKEEIEYEPGLAIAGCRFKKIHADEETKKLIKQNGGVSDF